MPWTSFFYGLGWRIHGWCIRRGLGNNVAMWLQNRLTDRLFWICCNRKW